MNRRLSFSYSLSLFLFLNHGYRDQALISNFFRNLQIYLIFIRYPWWSAENEQPIRSQGILRSTNRSMDIQHQEINQILRKIQKCLLWISRSSYRDYEYPIQKFPAQVYNVHTKICICRDLPRRPLGRLLSEVYEPALAGDIHNSQQYREYILQCLDIEIYIYIHLYRKGWSKYEIVKVRW